MVGYMTPFFLHNKLRGLEQSLVDPLLHPDFTHDLLQRITDTEVGRHRKIFESCRGLIDVAQVTDDYGSQTGPLISLDCFRRFYRPHLQRCIDLAGRLAVAFASAEREEALYRQAHFDELTGLPNRQLLKDRLEQQIVHATREGIDGALLFLDLDRFKEINDVYGHSVGDVVLTQAAERIVAEVRDTDTVARLGGLPGPLELRDALVSSAAPMADLVESAARKLRPRLVVNRTKVRTDLELGAAMRTMAAYRLGVNLEYLGYVESDDAVWLAA